MRLRVLGALEIVPDDDAHDSAAGRLRAPKLRRLLAGLVLRANTVVSVDWLADVVWGDELPANADAALHNLVSRLRGALREVAPAVPAGQVPAVTPASAPVLHTRAPGYLLEVSPDDLDATRFEKLAAQARSRLATYPEEAAALLDEALGLWRGPAYAEFADEEFARPEAARLEEARTTAVEDRIEAALAAGRPDEAVRRLERVLAEHSLRERPHAQLMLALYRSGRQADALAAYARYRERIDDELGLEPSAELKQLQARILRQDRELQGRPAPVPTPRGPSDAVPPDAAPQEPRTTAREPEGDRRGNLPAAMSALLGREGAAAQVAAALGHGRVVTLTGAGGIGKTSLALSVGASLAAAGTYADGVWLVELASLEEPGAVADAVTAVLSVQQRQNLAVTERLVDYLQPKRLLLVLDNCEHVVEAVARLTDALVHGCTGVTVLATSREPIGVDGEYVLPVPPLPVPAAGAHSAAELAQSPAAALLLERAAAAGPALDLAASDPEAIAEICRRLDGVPLALELAAARLRSMTPAEVLDRLSARFHFLRTSRRLSAERHRTLRSVVDWSYELLSEEERHVFDRLSVLAGTFSLRLAEQIAGEEDTADVLTALVDKSMVLAVPGRDGVTRHHLLETMRAYGLERLVERGELEAMRQRHAVRVVEMLEDAATRLPGPDCVPCADAIGELSDDLRFAHGWALEHDLELALRLVAGLLDYTEIRMPPEMFRWAERTLDALPEGYAGPNLPLVCAVAAGGARFRGDLPAAIAFADRGLAATDGPDDVARRFPQYLLVEVALFEGRLDDAVAIAGEVERLAVAAGDHMRAAMAAANRALARAYAGQGEEAVRIARTAREHAGRSRDPLVDAWMTYVEGEVRLDSDPQRAAALLEEALAQGRSYGDRYLAGVALVSAASVRGRYGDPREAVPLFRDVIEHWHCSGNWLQQWTTVRNVVDLLVRLGWRESGAVLLGAVSTRTTAAPVFGADAQRLRELAAGLRDELGAQQFAVLTTQGAGLSDGEVVASACAALEEAQIREAPPTASRTTGARHAVATADPGGGERLYGRDADLARLLDALDAGRLVTVTGPGGVGKTTIATAAARRLTAAGRATVTLELAPLSRDADVGVALAGALRLRAGLQEATLDAVIEFLSRQRLLILLDNCEHLRPAVVAVLSAVLAGAPGVTVLATSRERLGVDGEQVFALSPLSVPEADDAGGSPYDVPAVRLFVDRARRVQPAFPADDAELQLVADVCRALDGMPLAIELAAGRLAALGLADLRDHLDDSLDLLEASAKGERHATLRAVVAWSYELLEEPARVLLQRLSVFPATFDLSAVEEVAADDEPGGVARSGVPRWLAALVDASVVSVESGDVAASGRLRYRMLDVIRRFAAERLGESGDPAAVERRHVDWAVELVETAGRGLETPDEVEWVRRVAVEFPNIRAAWHRAFDAGDTASAARIVIALRSYVAWRWSGHVELHQWARRLVEDPRFAGSPYEPVVFGVAAEGAAALGEVDLAEELARTGMERSDGSPRARMACLYSLGLVALLRRRFDESAQRWLEVSETEGLPDVDRASHRANAVLPRLLAGDIGDSAADVARYREYADSEVGPSARAWVRYLEGQIAQSVPERRAEAMTLLEQAVDLAAESSASFIEGLAATSLVTLRTEAGDVDAALDRFPDVLRHWQRAGAWVQVWMVVGRLALLLADLGVDEAAAQLLAATDASKSPPPLSVAESSRMQEVRSQLQERLGDSRFADIAAAAVRLPRAEVVRQALLAADGVRRTRDRETASGPAGEG